jgi:guanosine-3',5'-bis(diphosphate) 3'-pyrophosphohydrolase
MKREEGKFSIASMDMFLKTLTFAAEKHQNQRRKGKKELPYVNHPIQVTHILWEIGQVRDVKVLTAALLHDTLEDTDTTPSEIQTLCGKAVLNLVQEVTDNKSLPKHLRKQLQIEHAALISQNAKLIKLADKICNVHDLIHAPPLGWSIERIIAYLDWSEAVIAQLRGTNQALEAEYDRVLAEAKLLLGESDSNALS